MRKSINKFSIRGGSPLNTSFSIQSIIIKMGGALTNFIECVCVPKEMTQEDLRTACEDIHHKISDSVDALEIVSLLHAESSSVLNSYKLFLQQEDAGKDLLVTKITSLILTERGTSELEASEDHDLASEKWNKFLHHKGLYYSAILLVIMVAFFIMVYSMDGLSGLQTIGVWGSYFGTFLLLVLAYASVATILRTKNSLRKLQLEGKQGRRKNMRRSTNIYTQFYTQNMEQVSKEIDHMNIAGLNLLIGLADLVPINPVRSNKLKIHANFLKKALESGKKYKSQNFKIFLSDSAKMINFFLFFETLFLFVCSIPSVVLKITLLWDGVPLENSSSTGIHSSVFSLVLYSLALLLLAFIASTILFETFMTISYLNGCKSQVITYIEYFNRSYVKFEKKNQHEAEKAPQDEGSSKEKKGGPQQQDKLQEQAAHKEEDVENNDKGPKKQIKGGHQESNHQMIDENSQPKRIMPQIVRVFPDKKRPKGDNKKK